VAEREGGWGVGPHKWPCVESRVFPGCTDVSFFGVFFLLHITFENWDCLNDGCFIHLCFEMMFILGITGDINLANPET